MKKTILLSVLLLSSLSYAQEQEEKKKKGKFSSFMKEKLLPAVKNITELTQTTPSSKNITEPTQTTPPSKNIHLDGLKMFFGGMPSAKEYFKKADRILSSPENLISNPSCDSKETIAELQKTLKSLYGTNNMNGGFNNPYLLYESEDNKTSNCHIEVVSHKGTINMPYQVMKNKDGETLVIPILL